MLYVAHIAPSMVPKFVGVRPGPQRTYNGVKIFAREEEEWRFQNWLTIGSQWSAGVIIVFERLHLVLRRNGPLCAKYGTVMTPLSVLMVDISIFAISI